VQFDLIIVGAGAAGMLAAIRAAECGSRTLLLEKNDQAGVKILMSGGTRCNITHATDHRGIAEAFAGVDRRQAQFLRSALATLHPEQLIELIESVGVPTKVEDTGKVFPVSNRAIDVRDALMRRVAAAEVVVQMQTPVTKIRRDEAYFIVESDDQYFRGRKLLITTGGRSYPGSGTTGDGYAWARELGHAIVDPVPALTPITTDDEWVRELKGITLPDASLSIVHYDELRESSGYSQKHFLDTRQASLLFTHFGFSGPAALDLSRVITHRFPGVRLRLVCDFVPGPDPESFATGLTANIRQSNNRKVANLVQEFVPRRLTEAVVAQIGIPSAMPTSELSKKKIRQLVRALKANVISVSGTMGFRKAEVTAGGVSLREVDSRTMQSKLVEGLYFAGEVLDIDGPIGGFNFQAAFSTGWLAGQCAAAE